MAQFSTKIEEYCKANNVNTVNFRSDVLLQSDNGDEVVYIHEWNLAIPQPTLEQIESYETVANQTEANAVDVKASGNTKLLDLGLTQAEATALTGYVPPAEV
tara:strand:+ start:736 stop:1041 length:306 start_codon:yes stop_codon:yes gene_type:complete